jgi:putative flippase GtrA
MDGVHANAQLQEDVMSESRTAVCGLLRCSRSRAMFRRFAKFSAVGAGGVIVQIMTLSVLLRVGGMHYLAATALAVEASVLNNFVWHRRWTWADRPGSSPALVLLRFNATNGAMSLIGNLAVMFILVSGLKLNPYAANLITIAICSLVNFALADRVVFT